MYTNLSLHSLFYSKKLAAWVIMCMSDWGMPIMVHADGIMTDFHCIGYHANIVSVFDLRQSSLSMQASACAGDEVTIQLPRTELEQDRADTHYAEQYSNHDNYALATLSLVTLYDHNHHGATQLTSFSVCSFLWACKKAPINNIQSSCQCGLRTVTTT